LGLGFWSLGWLRQRMAGTGLEEFSPAIVRAIGFTVPFTILAFRTVPHPLNAAMGCD